MSTALLMEVLGGGAARYRLDPPWEGHQYVAVFPTTLPDGHQETHILASDETGTATKLVLLKSVEGDISQIQALLRLGYTRLR